jgi:hypothetical protein
MRAEPLKKAIYAKAKELGVTKITLSFSGGSDEGHLDVSFDFDEDRIGGQLYPDNLYKTVEDWVWDVYEYSGAGDGSDYGDYIVYDLERGKVSTQEWTMQQTVEEELYDTLETR